MSDQSVRASVAAQMRAAADNYQISTIGPGDARQIADLLDAPGPRPLLDREALTDAFMARREAAGGCVEGPDCAACRRLAGEEADVALNLARSMPTREQIARAQYEQDAADGRTGFRSWDDASELHRGEYLHAADAVLALINGSKS